MLDIHGIVKTYPFSGVSSLVLIQKPSTPGANRHPEPCDQGNCTRRNSLNDEQVLPVFEAAMLEVEDAVCWFAVSDVSVQLLWFISPIEPENAPATAYWP